MKYLHSPASIQRLADSNLSRTPIEVEHVRTYCKWFDFVEKDNHFEKENGINHEIELTYGLQANRVATFKLLLGCRILLMKEEHITSGLLSMQKGDAKSICTKK